MENDASKKKNLTGGEGFKKGKADKKRKIPGHALKSTAHFVRSPRENGANAPQTAGAGDQGYYSTRALRAAR